MSLAARQRKDQVAADVFSVSLLTDHVDALHRIFALPDAAPPDLVLQSEDVLHAAHILENHFEFWGILVFERVIDLHTLDRMNGGVVRACWRKLHPYIQHQRVEQNVPNMAEWFQWLAERLEQYPAPGKKEGAYVSQQNWAPRLPPRKTRLLIL